MKRTPVHAVPASMIFLAIAFVLRLRNRSRRQSRKIPNCSSCPATWAFTTR